MPPGCRHAFAAHGLGDGGLHGRAHSWRCKRAAHAKLGHGCAVFIVRIGSVNIFDIAPPGALRIAGDSPQLQGYPQARGHALRHVMPAQKNQCRSDCRPRPGAPGEGGGFAALSAPIFSAARWWPEDRTGARAT